MHAYSELYVLDAQEHLGAMLDFATNGAQVSLTDFFTRFLSSSLAAAFEQGCPRVLAGMSGTELALHVMADTKMPDEIIVASQNAAHNFTPIGGASPEFWTGWALAYYQWSTNQPFALIQADVPIAQIAALYHPFHEMDLSSFCRKMEQLSYTSRPKTRLHEARKRAGLSQSQLAKASGVPIRTLQQYEQGQKCIDRAQVQYVLSLARVLHCSVDELLEYNNTPRYEYHVVTLPD